MKTLYISDLDGTLLTPDACLSERSTQLLQQLSAEGVLFSCATARSIVSVRSILSRVQMPVPVVLMNGVCIYDMHVRQYLHYETIGVQTALQVTEILEQMQVPAFLYTIEGQELGCFHHRLDDPVMEAYRAARPQRFDRPFTQVDSLTQAVSDRTIYITWWIKKIGSRRFGMRLRTCPVCSMPFIRMCMTGTPGIWSFAGQVPPSARQWIISGMLTDLRISSALGTISMTCPCLPDVTNAMLWQMPGMR